MQDRELLELAAKAGGIGGEYRDNHEPADYRSIEPSYGIWKYPFMWNPRINEADALRLLAVMRGSIECVGGTIRAFKWDERGFWISSPRLVIGNRSETDVMREAITKLAAEVGKSM